MKFLSRQVRDSLLHQLRRAVCIQIVVWDAAELIVDLLKEEQVDAVLGVMHMVDTTQAAQIEHEFTDVDLNTFLMRLGTFRKNISEQTRRALLQQLRVGVVAETELQKTRQ